MPNIESFVLFTESWNGMQYLTDEQLGKLLRALMAEHEVCEMPELDRETMIVFQMMIPRIRANRQRYEEVCAKRREAGAKGGKQKVANLSNAKQNVATPSNAKHTDTDPESDTDSDLDAEADTKAKADLDTPPIAPQGGQDAQAGKRPTKDAPICAEDWERWYAAYPKHEGKQTAIRAWNKAHKEGVLPSIETLLDTLTWQKQRWTDPQYIPMPSSYLNGRRWQDEKPAPQPQPQPMNGYPRFQQTSSQAPAGERIYASLLKVQAEIDAEKAAKQQQAAAIGG